MVNLLLGHRRALFAALLCLLALPNLVTAQNGEPAPSLSSEIAAVITHPTLEEATIGILAVDLASGEVLIDYIADKPLIVNLGERRVIILGLMVNVSFFLG